MKGPSGRLGLPICLALLLPTVPLPLVVSAGNLKAELGPWKAFPSLVWVKAEQRVLPVTPNNLSWSGDGVLYKLVGSSG